MNWRIRARLGAGRPPTRARVRVPHPPRTMIRPPCWPRARRARRRSLGDAGSSRSPAAGATRPRRPYAGRSPRAAGAARAARRAQPRHSPPRRAPDRAWTRRASRRPSSSRRESLSAGPLSAGAERDRRLYSRRLDAHEPPLVSGLQIMETGGALATGIPDHRVGKALGLEEQRTIGFPQLERPRRADVDAVDVIGEEQSVGV